MSVSLAMGFLLLASCRPEQQLKRDEPIVKIPPEIVKATGVDVPEEIRREVVRAREDRRDVLVYVGAKWCEPCRRFHDAIAAGELTKTFPGLRVVEFDLDRDRDGLEHAGYTSKMIPLFALPREDGRGSGDQIEGSIKGPGAVQEITPRLQALLSKQRDGH